MNRVRLKRLFDSASGGSWGVEPEEGEVTLPCVRGTDFDYQALRVNTRRAPVRGFASHEVAKRAARRGDLIIEKSGGGEQQPVGRAALHDSDDIVMPTNFAARLSPSADSDSRFLTYLLSSLYAIGATRASIKQTTGIQNLDLHSFLDTVVSRPSLQAQRVIADFLDAETARIDALIEKKRHLIDLLQARWLAHVRELVTGNARFSDPLNVSQREVGWETAKAIKLSRFLHFGSGTTPPSADESMYGGQIPWLLTGDLNDGRLHKTSRTVTEKAIQEIGPLVVHPPKSLVIAMYGATIGKLAILDVPACVNQACSVLTPRGDDRVEFVFYWLLAHRRQLVERGYGAGQPNISQELLKAIRIALPPVEIQVAIISQLSESRTRLAKIAKRLNQQLELLTEHRQALITAAVTREFEVPGLRNYE